MSEEVAGQPAVAPPMQPLLERLLAWTQHDPQRPAIIADERAVSYAEFVRAASRAAGWLRHQGVRPGDRVAWIGRNRIDFFELFVGAVGVGAVIVPLNWRLAPDELEQIIADARPRLLVGESEFLPAASAATAAADTAMAVHPVADTAFDWGDTSIDLPFRAVESTDPLWLVYTSGTTGTPKGVVITHGNFLAMFDGLATAWRFVPGRVTYMPYPVFHGAGILWVFGPLLTGGTAILRRAFDPADLAAACREHAVTNTMMVPAVLQRVLDADIALADLSGLQTIVYGVSPITERVLERALEAFPHVEFVHAYGLTEATGAVTVMPWADHRPGTERMRSCGRAYDFVELRIVDPETGADLPPRSVGEVWVRGDVVMPGYFNRPAETAAAIADGWLRTGDGGYLDEDGFLYLTDRIKDMIITGGENVYPAEVENVLFGHPCVREAAVFGAPDHAWGERVVAAVVASHPVTADDLIAYTRDRLAHYKCPRTIEFVDELPRNPTGKVLRRQLRDPYWVGHDRSIV